jgi:hypothetical protein
VSSKRLYHVLELPKHLQVTILALLKLGPSSATAVSVVTGKARALESSYLNQLVTLKLVRKEQRMGPLHHGKPIVVCKEQRMGPLHHGKPIVVCKEQRMGPLHHGKPIVFFSVDLEALDW